MARSWLGLLLLAACSGTSGSPTPMQGPPPPPPHPPRAPERPEPPESYTSLSKRPPLALRPLAPLSGTRVRVRRPRLRWEMPAEAVQTARVELCAARDCRRVLETLRSPGGAASPARDLPVGPVYWRVSAGEETSATWRLDIRPAAAATTAEVVQGTAGDLTGDDAADAFVARTLGPPPTDAALLYRGSHTGLVLGVIATMTPGPGRPGMLQGHRLPRGDIDGDGRDDLLAGSTVMLGGAQGLRRSVALEGGESRLAIVADVNGDGRDDVVRAQPYADTSVEPAVGRLMVHLGEAGGVALRPSQTVEPPAAELRLFGAELSRAGDVNGDGFDDVLAVGEAPAGASDFDHPYRMVLLLGSSRGLGWGGRVEVPQEEGARGPWTAQWLVAEGLGDRDGDGFDDFAVLERSGNTFRVRFYRGGARGPTRDGPPTDVSAGTGIASAGDLDGDGLPEMVLVSPTSIVLRAGGVNGREQTLASPGWCASSPGDIDADGYADLVVAAGRDEVRVYYGGAGDVLARPGTVLRPNAPMMAFGSWVD